MSAQVHSQPSKLLCEKCRREFLEKNPEMDSTERGIIHHGTCSECGAEDRVYVIEVETAPLGG